MTDPIDSNEWHPPIESGRPQQPRLRKGFSPRELLAIFAIMALLWFLLLRYAGNVERERQARWERQTRQKIAEIEKEIQTCEDAERRGLPYDPKPRRAISGALPDRIVTWRQEADWLREIITPAAPKP